MQSLTKELQNRLKGAKRVAVLGVGSDLRGDDAAGMLVAQRMGKYESRITNHERRKGLLRVFYGSTAPENLTGEIRRFKPTHLIIVDTADIKQKPGTVLLLKGEDVSAGISFSTHKLPPRVMVDYFGKTLKCRIILIGIQPKTLEFGRAVSKEVKGSAKDVSDAIISVVNSPGLSKSKAACTGRG